MSLVLSEKMGQRMSGKQSGDVSFCCDDFFGIDVCGGVFVGVSGGFLVLSS